MSFPIPPTPDNAEPNPKHQEAPEPAPEPIHPANGKPGMNGQGEHTSTHTSPGFLEYQPPTETDLKRGIGDLRLLSRSLREQWPISESLRTKGVAFCEAVLDNGPTVRDGLKAVDVLARLDNVNRGRERNAIESRQGEQRDERELVRILLQSAGLRQQTADVTARADDKVSAALNAQVIETKQDTVQAISDYTPEPGVESDSAAVG